MAAVPKRLYDFPFSGNGYKVRLALAQLGIGVEYRSIDLIARETRADWFLAINPLGEIPVLELSDGTLLRESNAILCWLCEGTRLMPREAVRRARVIQWMMFEQNMIDKVMGRTRFLKRWPGFMATTQADWAGWYATGYRALDVMEAELARQDYFAGEAYSAADICLYGYVHCAEEGGFSFAQHGNVRHWLDRVRAEPGHVGIDRVPGL